MMNFTEISIYFVLSTLLACASLLDIYAMMARTAVTREKNSEVFAISNWIQYQARILTMVTAFSLSFCLEHAIIGSDIRTLFFFSGIEALIMIGLLVRTSTLSGPLCILQKLTVSRFFGSLGAKDFKREVQFCGKGRVLFISFLVGYLVLAATIVPFVFSQSLPQYRMTLVYIGQAFNFGASILTFTSLDRYFYQSMDAGSEQAYLNQQIGGRLFAQVAITLSLAASYFFV